MNDFLYLSNYSTTYGKRTSISQNRGEIPDPVSLETTLQMPATNGIPVFKAALVPVHQSKCWNNMM